MAELSQVMKMLGNDLTDQELRDIMKEAGATKSIGYSAFCKLMGGGGVSKARKETDPEEEMRDAFGLFDLDRDGYISASEMKTGLAKFGVTLTEREVDQVCTPPSYRPARTQA